MVLRAVTEAVKSIVQFPGWSKPDDDDGYIHFQAPLSIAGVAEAGLFLQGGTYARFPDRHVTLEVVLLTGGGYRRTKLMRVDWRSLRGGHTNRRRYKCPCGDGRVGDTHYHAFELNWLEDQQRLRGPRLPCARDIYGGLQSFEELSKYVGNTFKINNIDLVSVPDWEYILPYDDDRRSWENG